jgi:hypothetical protein
VYVVELGYVQQLSQETIPHTVIASPIGAKILSTGFDAPLDLLRGDATACPRIAHLASKITVVAKIYVYVNRSCVGNARRIKVLSSWALFKTIRKCPMKNNTFLIASDSTTIAAY